MIDTSDMRCRTQDPDMEDYVNRLEQAVDKARERGFEVVRTNKNTILLDLDTAYDLHHYVHMKDIAEKSFGIKETNSWRSKSGKGMHVVLHSNKDLSFLERLLIQACLGSDRKREILGYFLWQKGEIAPSVLFKPRDAEELAA